jgi:hypothetical protein
MISTAVSPLERYSFGRCPRSLPSPDASFWPTTKRTVQTPIPAFFHSASSVSAKEEKQHRGHVVALSDTHRLREFNNFLLDFEDNSKILVSAFNGWDKSGGGSILFEYVQKKAVVGRVLSLNKINKRNIGGKIVILPHGE